VGETHGIEQIFIQPR